MVQQYSYRIGNSRVLSFYCWKCDQSYVVLAKDNQTPIDQVSGCNNNVHKNGAYGCGGVQVRFESFSTKG